MWQFIITDNSNFSSQRDVACEVHGLDKIAHMFNELTKSQFVFLFDRVVNIGVSRSLRHECFVHTATPIINRYGRMCYHCDMRTADKNILHIDRVMCSRCVSEIDGVINRQRITKCPSSMYDHLLYNDRSIRVAVCYAHHSIYESVVCGSTFGKMVVRCHGISMLGCREIDGASYQQFTERIVHMIMLCKEVIPLPIELQLFIANYVISGINNKWQRDLHVERAEHI